MSGSEFGVLLTVGPDGVRDSAVEFAADEAIARATGVELLHVMHSMVALPSSAEQMEMIDRSMAKVGLASPGPEPRSTSSADGTG